MCCADQKNREVQFNVRLCRGFHAFDQFLEEWKRFDELPLFDQIVRLALQRSEA